MDDSIVINVKTQFLAQHSRPENRHFVFAYTITITNCGAEAAQLISRYWRIRDNNNKTQEVHGTGVVGEQPRIEAGGHYTYTSSAILATEAGTMEGFYIMRRDNGDTFKVPIPTFGLVPSHAIH